MGKGCAFLQYHLTTINTDVILYYKKVLRPNTLNYNRFHTVWHKSIKICIKVILD